MSFEDIYSCNDCDFEIRQEDELFFYNPDSKETISYILLMSTAGMDEGFKTKGCIYRSYCKCCDKFVKIYVIREGGGSNMIQQVYQGIKNHFEGYADKILVLKEIKKREKFFIEKKNGFYSINFHELDSYGYFKFLDIGDCEEEVVKMALKDFHKTIDSRINLFEKLYQKESQIINIVVDESDEPTKMVSRLKRSISKVNVGHSWEDRDFIKCPQCGNKITFRGLNFLVLR